MKRTSRKLHIDSPAPNEQARPSGWQKRKLRSLCLGWLDLEIRQYRCTQNKRLRSPIDELAAPEKQFCYETAWECFRMRFIDNMSRKDILAALHQRGLKISDAAVSHQYWEGAAYIKELHLATTAKLGQRYREKGFVLALDATNEEGSFKRICARDALTGETIFTLKALSDDSETYEQLLRNVQFYFGKPDAVMSDMCPSIERALRQVFPNVPHLICQYHFLRNAGKDLLSKAHARLGKAIKGLKILSPLGALKRRILLELSTIEDETEQKKLHSLSSLIHWILDYKSVMTGNGAPFDLVWLELYKRLLHGQKTIETMIDQGSASVSKIFRRSPNP